MSQSSTARKRVSFDDDDDEVNVKFIDSGICNDDVWEVIKTFFKKYDKTSFKY